MKQSKEEKLKELFRLQKYAQFLIYFKCYEIASPLIHYIREQNNLLDGSK